MATQTKLARCTDCDLLIPTERQLGLHGNLYCTIPDHWQAHGYNAFEVMAGLDRHAACRPSLREAVHNAKAHQLLRWIEG
jgi:hypothetical protein